jgi:hypothetical protein
MAEIKAKKVLFKNRDGEHLIPYVGDTAIENRITNCILEVPQRIKLELADGVLTLKAGSEVIVPNGFEADGVTPKFDYVTIKNDSQGINGANQQEVILASSMKYGYDNVQIAVGTPSAWTYSGATQPTVSTTFAIWYDTANNKIKQTINNGSTWLEGLSLPIALATSSTTQYTSIDQVFNGLGYIGSTVWVDKDVKGLIPNGRNEDGTLKNIEFTVDKVLTSTTSNPYTNYPLVIGVDSGFGPYVPERCEYKEDINRNYNNDSNVFVNGFVFGYASSDGKVTSFNPKQPFRAVDYNDYRNDVSNLARRLYVTETYQNGTSWYRVWSDKWCEQGFRVGGQAQRNQYSYNLLRTMRDTNYSAMFTENSGASECNQTKLYATSTTQVTVATPAGGGMSGGFVEVRGYIA